MFGRNRNPRVTALLACAALGVGSGCEKATQRADPDTEMREIYFLSYLPGQVQPVITYVLQALGQQRAQFSEEQYAIAESLVREQMGPDKLEAATLERLGAQQQREYMEESIEWLKSPVVRKFVALKSSAWSPSGLQAMRTYIEQKQQNPPSARRLALLERYDDATGSSSLTAETMLLAAYSVAVIHDALQPIENRVGPKELQDSMATQRSVLKPIFKETSNVAHRFAFSQVSDDEVEAIVTFAESDTGQWLYTTLSANFLDALLATSANLRDQFLAALPEPPSS